MCDIFSCYKDDKFFTRCTVSTSCVLCNLLSKCNDKIFILQGQLLFYSYYKGSIWVLSSYYKDNMYDLSSYFKDNMCDLSSYYKTTFVIFLHISKTTCVIFLYISKTTCVIFFAFHITRIVFIIFLTLQGNHLSSFF